MSRLARPALPPDEGGPLTHSRIWNALDALATRFGMSPSGLAKKAGLDATTFNRSKRRTADGRLRWPSTESVSKVLEATGASLADFLALAGEGDGDGETNHDGGSVPLIGLADASKKTSALEFDGRASGPEWMRLDLPTYPSAGCFGIAISGDGWPPHYAAGTVLLVSFKTPCRTGDRVLLKPIYGKLVAGLVLDASPSAAFVVRTFGATQSELKLRTDQVAWVARILWCSQ